MPISNLTQPVRTMAVLLFDGFSNLCLANAIEPLRAANMLSGHHLYQWDFLALTAAPLASSSGLAVQPAPLSRHGGGEGLLVMPGYGHESHATPACLSALRAADRRFSMLAGLDTGSWLLAAAGLLDGYKATSHWDILTDFAERFPEVSVVEDRFVIDGRRASSGGATTTLELMLDLVERHHGARLALDVAALFMIGVRDADLPPPSGRSPRQTVLAAATLMRRSVEQPLPIEAIARAVGLGQRALEKAFQDGFGASPVRIYRSIRLGEARRRLTQTTASVAEIATRCGYRDATAMARAFKAEFGCSPLQARKDARNGGREA